MLSNEGNEISKYSYDFAYGAPFKFLHLTDERKYGQRYQCERYPQGWHQRGQRVYCSPHLGAFHVCDKSLPNASFCWSGPFVGEISPPLSGKLALPLSGKSCLSPCNRVELSPDMIIVVDVRCKQKCLKTAIDLTMAVLLRACRKQHTARKIFKTALRKQGRRMSDWKWRLVWNNAFLWLFLRELHCFNDSFLLLQRQSWPEASISLQRLLNFTCSNTQKCQEVPYI